jgi:hypothetical protein
MPRISITGTLKIPKQYMMSHFMTKKVTVWCVVSGWKINGPTTFLRCGELGALNNILEPFFQIFTEEEKHISSRIT